MPECTYAVPQRPGGHQASRKRVTSGCELPNVGPGN